MPKITLRNRLEKIFTKSGLAFCFMSECVKQCWLVNEMHLDHVIATPCAFVNLNSPDEVKESGRAFFYDTLNERSGVILLSELKRIVLVHPESIYRYDGSDIPPVFLAA